MELKKVVVTGLGALTPIGNNVPDFWNAVVAGTNGAGPITHFDCEAYKTHFACELKNFDFLNYMTSKEANKIDGCTKYAYVATQEAVKDARLDDPSLNRERIGLCLGSGIGGVATTATDIVDFAHNNEIPHFSPFFILKSLSNMVAGNLSILFDLRGPSSVMSSACSSGASAIAEACHFIQLGKADIMVSGGAEASITPVGIGGFNAMRALSTRNDDFLSASRPFAVGRDGFVMGEGAGIIVLEELEHAKARGARIYAEVCSVGLTSDAYHVTSPCPDGRGAAQAMRNALAEAGVKPEEVGHINMHGTSTPLGDIAECKAIETVFGDHSRKMLFNSMKSMTGHLLGAASAVEGIATILALEKGIVHPTINLQERDPQIPDWNFCADGAEKASLRYALCNSFGFGGHNASILFKKFEN